MKYRRNNKSLLTSLFVLLILSIGIVYAYLTSNLSITGATEIAAHTWDIHFANLNITNGSVEAVTPASISASNTEISYAVRLSRPKDFYEFTVDVVNAGSLPGKVNIVTIDGISTYSNIVDYSITYTNGNSVQVDNLINPGSIKTIRVRVYYKDDINANDLPNTAINLDLTFNLVYNQSKVLETNASNLLQNLSSSYSCIAKYTGQVTDRVGVTETATNVYFDKCEDKRNIIFGGFCWQAIRTTETGGLKILYNGEPVDGKCESSRSDHKGIVQSNYGSQNIGSSYLYGSSFTYDTMTNEFTIVDTETATWSDSTYENLLGKFTCVGLNDTCTTLYEINGYVSNNNAYLSYYTIADTNYAQIGTSSFNADSRSPAMVGYMFNKQYKYKSKSISERNKFGSTFTYANGTYTLSGTTQDLTSLNGANIANTHYTCWNDTGTCNNISYVYYVISTYGYYIEISDGKSIIDAMNEMLYNNDVNRYNSSIKGIIDSWYAQNLATKTSMIEDTVYCGARNMSNQSVNGWNPDGGNTSYDYQMYFKNYNSTIDLACPNETDQFAVENNKAKLTYPVALLQDEERYNISTSALMSTGATWWQLSPYHFSGYYANVFKVNYDGGNSSGTIYVYNAYGARPVVSLSSDAVISSGSGSEDDPWIVE